jgi:hypothetical protein
MADCQIIPGEGEHIVVFEDGQLMVRHPSCERRDEPPCGLLEHIRSLEGRPVPIGSYLVTGQPGNLTWKEVGRG